MNWQTRCQNQSNTLLRRSPLALVIEKLRHARYSTWKRNLLPNSLGLKGTGPRLRPDFENCPNFAVTVTPSFVLSTWDKTVREFLQCLLS